jgi:hypothetical protein
VTDYVARLVQNFSRIPDKREAHRRSQPILRELAHDPGFLREVIENFVSQEKSLLGTLFLPFIIVPIDSNRYFELSAHLWPPLPESVPSISHQSIHHHGKLLLTSIAPLGGGYESILFHNDWKTDPATGQAHLRVDRFYANSAFNLEFVDTWTPHVVFFPRSFSVTIALWSKDRDYPSESLKQNALVKTFKEPIKKLIVGLGMQNLTGVNPETSMDFCIRDGGCYAMKDRVYYQDCTNAEYVENLVPALRQLPFDSEPLLSKMNAFYLERGLQRQASTVSRALKSGRADFRFYTPERMGDRHVNIPKQDILRSFDITDSPRVMVRAVV